MRMHQAKPCVGIQWVLRNGKRKEPLKGHSEVKADYYALVCPGHYFLFSLNLSKSCSRLSESPTQHWEAGLGMPGQGQTMAASNAHTAQPAPSCHGSMVYVCLFSPPVSFSLLPKGSPPQLSLSFSRRFGNTHRYRVTQSRPPHQCDQDEVLLPSSVSVSHRI